MRRGLVQLLVPPATHHDSLRVMPEQELLALTPSELAARAALLMTSEDPQGMIACSGIAIDQAILALGAVAPQPQARLIAAILRNKHDELQAWIVLTNLVMMEAMMEISWQWR